MIIIILSNGNYFFDFSASGFNFFYAEFKFAIITAGLALPSAAFFAAIHRSQQTANQITLMQEDNTFNNHFKHLEEFKSQIMNRHQFFRHSPAVPRIGSHTLSVIADY